MCERLRDYDDSSDNPTKMFCSHLDGAHIEILKDYPNKAQTRQIKRD